MGLTDSRFQLYDKPEYFAALTQRCVTAGSGSRLVLTSMMFEPDEPAVTELLEALVGAADRGAEVIFAVDARSFMVAGSRPGPLLLHNKMPHQLATPFREKLQLLQRISRSPRGRALIINQPGHAFSIPIAGRSHIKLALVDDEIFIGGCNLDHPEFIDITTSWHDARAADELFETVSKLQDGDSIKQLLGGHDKTIVIDPQADLLIDAGISNQSAIFEAALKMIDSARKWLTMTCQFFPNSITAQHLVGAQKRGVKVDIIYTPPLHHSNNLVSKVGQLLSVTIEHTRVPTSLFNHSLGAKYPKIHAKLIACDMGMMIGSHNYVRAGVRLGTAEIALRSSDERLATAAVDSIRRSVLLAAKTV